MKVICLIACLIPCSRSIAAPRDHLSVAGLGMLVSELFLLNHIACYNQIEDQVTARSVITKLPIGGLRSVAMLRVIGINHATENHLFNCGIKETTR